ncbi:hypothetical protein D3C86_1793950 [compost metagenome]
MPCVWMIAGCPWLSTPKCRWGWAAERMASQAMPTPPSVPFLNPTGMPRPLAISRWICDSVVRAPMATQLSRSSK